MGKTIQKNELVDQISELFRRVSTLENQSKKIFGNIEIDGNTGVFFIRDSDGVPRVSIDGNTGAIKTSEEGTNVLTASNSELTFLSTYRQLRESTIHTSGGNTFTNVAPYVSIPDFLTNIDFDDWVDMDWYFEATLASGPGTGYVRLYNNTDSIAVPGSVISHTTASYVSKRVGPLTKYTGTKELVVQYGHTPSGGPTDFVNLTIARHIFRRPQ